MALEYGNMTALESDLKRMVQNAKEFNSIGSKLYEDAERIRKALSNIMPKYNPAYRDQEYRAVPTPIPETDKDLDGNQLPSNTEGAPVAPTIKLKVNGSTSRKSQGGLMDKTQAIGNKSMLQEQAKIVEEMIGLRDPGLVARSGCVCCATAIAYLVQ